MKAPGEAGRMLYDVEGLPEEEEGGVGQHRHWDHREDRKPGMCWWEVWRRGEQTEGITPTRLDFIPRAQGAIQGVRVESSTK